MLNIRKYNYPTSYNNFGNDIIRYELIPTELPRMYGKSSRYCNTKRIYDTKFNMYYHRFGDLFDIPETDDDVFHKVTIKDENRLDIIANNYYNEALYWWIIACANNIMDCFNVPEGTVLRIPPLTTLYNVGGILE